ncbi:hypothetical protein WG66_003963 [Moniliophthora roreri]|uniref:Uncharacterized protein n=1 Tax=Moniliophthora roreri TaxID=221103 RepID=A0A0W0EWP5_MONRR|nr:hypothetical protein WG66_003963 [Moniliophthora roreri]
MAITTIVESTGTTIYSSESVNFLVLWIIITTSLNVLLTALISFPILSARRRLLKLGLNVAPPNANMWVVAVLVESSLPFPVLGILYAVLSAKGIGVYMIFAVFWALYAGIAPLLIMYRVAKGTAWSNQNNIAYSDVSLRFAASRTEATTTDSVLQGTENPLV